MPNEHYRSRSTSVLAWQFGSPGPMPEWLSGWRNAFGFDLDTAASKLRWWAVLVNGSAPQIITDAEFRQQYEPVPPSVTKEQIETHLFGFLCRKYVQRADKRQQEMRLQYTEAETHDLAHETAKAVLALMEGKSNG